MHHHSEKDEFDPHGHLFLLYFKENSRISPLFLHPYFFTHIDFQIIIFGFSLSQAHDYNRGGNNRA